MEKWSDTEIVHDSPFPASVWVVIQHYRALDSDGLDLDRFKADCSATADSGHAGGLLIELAKLQQQLESDRDMLIGPDFLLDRLAQWRFKTTKNATNAYGVRNVYLDWPIDKWVNEAWDALMQLLSAVTSELDQLRSTVISSTSSSDQPPESYSPLAKVLFPFRSHFETPIPDVVHTLRVRSGEIIMSTSAQVVGALILETIRIGLDISTARHLSRVTIYFPKAYKAHDPKDGKKWFTTRNELANLVTTTRHSANPHQQFTDMETRMNELQLQLKDMKSQLTDPRSY